MAVAAIGAPAVSTKTEASEWLLVRILLRQVALLHTLMQGHHHFDMATVNGHDG